MQLLGQMFSSPRLQQGIVWEHLLNSWTSSALIRALSHEPDRAIFLECETEQGER